MNPTIAIALATTRELRHQRLLIAPVVAFALSMCILATVLVFGGLGELTATDAASALRWTCLAAGVGASIYAVIVGSGLIAQELAAGTMLMLAVRPISRWTITSGRILGAGSFLLVALLLVDLAYGLIASALSGSFAVPAALGTLAITVPGVLLCLAVGSALSVQQRTSAASGTAVAVLWFALGTATWTNQVRTEDHYRSYLRPEAAARLDANAPVVGALGELVVRIVPVAVLGAHAIDVVEETEFPDAYRDRPITLYGDGSAPPYASYPGPAPSPAPAAAATPAGATSAGATSAGADASADPSIAAGAPGPGAMTIPKDPPDTAFDCGMATCLLGYEHAWRQPTMPPPPEFASTRDVAFAWLMIPTWMLLAGTLLWRRRDLA